MGIEDGLAIHWDIPPDVPDPVRCISLWSRWASAVADGIKRIETRTWPWPYEPGWLAIHGAKQWDGVLEGRIQPFPAVTRGEPGALRALVYIAGCRPLVPADLDAALVYREGLYAWEITQLVRLQPHPMRGPQKFCSIPKRYLRPEVWRCEPCRLDTPWVLLWHTDTGDECPVCFGPVSLVDDDDGTDE